MRQISVTTGAGAGGYAESEAITLIDENSTLLDA